MTWRSKLTSPELFVFLTIADLYNEERGFAWPSVGYLADYTNLSERTVQRCLRRLEELELVDSSWSGSGKTPHRSFPLYGDVPVDNSPAGVREGRQSDTPRVTGSHPKGASVTPQGRQSDTQSLSYHLPEPFNEPGVDEEIFSILFQPIDDEVAS